MEGVAVFGAGVFAVVQGGSLQAGTFEVPQIGAKGYHVGEYGDGAYWVTDGLYNSMLVVSKEGVIVIDAPWSLADKLEAAIGEVMSKSSNFCRRFLQSSRA